MTEAPATFSHPDVFSNRHLGSAQADIETMLKTLGFSNLGEMVNKIVPETIRFKDSLGVGDPMSERQVMARSQK